MSLEIYYDNSATTRVRDEAIQVVTDTLINGYGNPSSLHRMGFAASQRLEQARTQIADVLGCETSCITFTSGGTESDNIAILGGAMARARRGKRIITTSIEHDAVLKVMSHLEKNGWDVVYLIPDSDGIVSAEKIAAAVDDNTTLVSIMAINNEIGSIQPIQQICKAVRAKNPNTLIHSDAVQAFGKHEIKLKRTSFDVDMLSISGHKIYAPKGIGALYIRKGIRIEPLSFGGGQEKNIRPGTENVAYACAMGLASKLLDSEMKDNTQNVAIIKNTILDQFSYIPQIIINSTQEASPYILNFSVPGIRSEIMLHFLESKDIYVSSGSACAKGKTSHVLNAIGLDKSRADSAIRLSFGRENSIEQVEIFIEAIKEAIGRFLKLGR